MGVPELLIFTWFRMNQHRLPFFLLYGMWWYIPTDHSDQELNTVRLQINADKDNPKYHHLDESRTESIE